MERFFESLRPFIRAVVRRAGLVVGLGLAASALGLYLALGLRIDTDFANLLPDDYASVQALDRLRANVGGESEVAVAIQSPSFEANKAYAEALIPRALAMRRGDGGDAYFTRVEYRRDTQFLEQNALYFATDAELDSLEAYLEEQVEEATLAANPFYFDLEDEEEEAGEGASTGLATVYQDIVGTEYPISPDSTVLVVRFFPTGSQTNVGFIEDLYADLDRLVADLEPTSFHPEMEVTTAGRLLRTLVEVQAITGDVFGSFGAGVASVLLAVMLYFAYKAYRARAGGRFEGAVLASVLVRLPILALVIALPLLMSLTWTFGLAYVTFGALNLMTSTLGLVLFGLGIDYGIHFYARYTEERGRGHSLVEAIEITFVSTGQAITVGALSTAAALYVLVIADFRGFSEFGFIAGTGVLLALVGMLVMLPALLTLFERFRLLNFEGNAVAPLSGGRAQRVPFPRGLVVGSLAAVVVAVVLLPRVSFEFRFGELEPEYTAYEARRDVVREATGRESRRNPAYVVVDSPEEVPAVVAAVRAKAAADTTSPTIASVESLQNRFPTTPAAQAERLQRIAAIRTMLDDPLLQAEPNEDLARVRRAASTTDPIEIDEVPEALRKQYTSKSGEVGNFVMIYPSVGLSDGRESIRFAEDVGTIVTEDGTVYHAGSTSLVAADMLRLMLAEAPWMILGTFVIVFLLMWVNFGVLRWALLALVPLVVGILWMLLLMEILGLKLNFYNLVVLPAVLGIGNDAGVHLVHRYREEGRGTIRRVLRSTGEHVTMGSVTTMIGFGGLMLSFHPGLRSIGELAVVGIGATLLAALIFLPGLLQSLEDRRMLRPHEAHAEAAPVE